MFKKLILSLLLSSIFLNNQTNIMEKVKELNQQELSTLIKILLDLKEPYSTQFDLLSMENLTLTMLEIDDDQTFENYTTSLVKFRKYDEKVKNRDIEEWIKSININQNVSLIVSGILEEALNKGAENNDCELKFSKTVIDLLNERIIEIETLLETND